MPSKNPPGTLSLLPRWVRERPRRSDFISSRSVGELERSGPTLPPLAGLSAPFWICRPRPSTTGLLAAFSPGSVTLSNTAWLTLFLFLLHVPLFRLQRPLLLGHTAFRSGTTQHTLARTWAMYLPSDRWLCCISATVTAYLVLWSSRAPARWPPCLPGKSSLPCPLHARFTVGCAFGVMHMKPWRFLTVAFDASRVARKCSRDHVRPFYERLGHLPRCLGC